MQQVFIKQALTHDVIAEDKGDGPCFYEVYLVVEKRGKLIVQCALPWGTRGRSKIPSAPNPNLGGCGSLPVFTVTQRLWIIIQENKVEERLLQEAGSEE